ncbi:MAG: hypothetical protein AMXMBFR13_42090 [Phycisphaerae bacterium]
MSGSGRTLLRYCVLAIVLTPFIGAPSYCILIADAMAGIATLNDGSWHHRSVPGQHAIDALGGLLVEIALGVARMPFGAVGYPMLIVNSVFWAAAISATIALLRFLLRVRTVPTGCCRECGYDLTGNLSGVCPECGTAVPEQAVSGQPSAVSRPAPGRSTDVAAPLSQARAAE